MYSQRRKQQGSVIGTAAKMATGAVALGAAGRSIGRHIGRKAGVKAFGKTKTGQVLTGQMEASQNKMKAIGQKQASGEAAQSVANKAMATQQGKFNKAQSRMNRGSRLAGNMGAKKVGRIGMGVGAGAGVATVGGIEANRRRRGY